MKTSHVCKVDEEGKIYIRQAFMVDWAKWITASFLVTFIIFVFYIAIADILKTREPSPKIQFRDWQDKPEIEIHIIPEETIYSV